MTTDRKYNVITSCVVTCICTVILAAFIFAIITLV